MSFRIFLFNDTPTTEIYTLSLHDALPIFRRLPPERAESSRRDPVPRYDARAGGAPLPEGGPNSSGSSGARRPRRSEEHTSELQSRLHLVCRLLLEKKKTRKEDTIRVDRGN